MLTYIKHLNAVVFTHGQPLTCPECGSLDEVNYHKTQNLYTCAFDGTVFDEQGVSNIEVAPYRLGEDNGWKMNVEDILFLPDSLKEVK
jgi:hypothetical protein